MGIAIGIIIFFIGCLISSVEDADASARRREAQRHEELKRILSERKETPAVQQTRVTRRRVAQDKDGNVLAEEITEETL